MFREERVNGGIFIHKPQIMKDLLTGTLYLKIFALASDGHFSAWFNETVAPLQPRQRYASPLIVTTSTFDSKASDYAPR